MNENGAPRVFLPNPINVAAGMVILIGVVLILKELDSLFQPLFIAIFFFYIGTPIVRILIRHRVPPTLAHLIIFALIISAVIGFAWMVGDSIDNLAQQLPAFQKEVRSMLVDSTGEISADLPYFSRRLRQLFLRTNIMDPFNLDPRAFLGNFVGFMSASILTVFYLVFLVHEQRTLPARLKAAYGSARAGKIEEIGRRINESIGRYIYVKFLASLASAVLAFGIMVAFGLDLAVLWTSIIFFANFIPYIGSIVAFSLPIAVSVLEFESASRIIGMASLLLVVDLMVGNYLEPRYAGDRLNLSPLVVLVALGFWGWLWGVIGLILAVPITVSLKFILENIPMTQNLGLLISHEPRRGEPIRQKSPTATMNH